MYNIKLADLVIQIKSDNDKLREFFKDYIVDEECDFVVEINDEDINKEKSFSIEKTSEFEYLKLATYRKICEQLPNYDAFLFHGSALYFDDKATLLAGHSGAGKSTHARLLREYYDAKMINDDKPLIRLINNIPYVYGTPYNGKHHLSQNISKPLKNIVFIIQDKENSISSINDNDAFNKLFFQTYRPYNKDALAKTIVLLDKLNKATNKYDLRCDISFEAANKSYEIIK